MKIIHHSQRQRSTCWLCTGGSACVLGWESHSTETVPGLQQPTACVFSPAARAKAPCWSPQRCWCPSPFPAGQLSPAGWRARQGRFHADGLFLPVAVATALGASRSEAGGRGSYLPGAHQGHWEHLIRHCSILGLRGARRSYQMTGSAAASRHSQGCSAAHCS